jgi:hypothetical protein
MIKHRGSHKSNKPVVHTTRVTPTVGVQATTLAPSLPPTIYHIPDNRVWDHRFGLIKPLNN